MTAKCQVDPSDWRGICITPNRDDTFARDTNIPLHCKLEAIASPRQCGGDPDNTSRPPKISAARAPAGCATLHRLTLGASRSRPEPGARIDAFQMNRPGFDGSRGGSSSCWEAVAFAFAAHCFENRRATANCWPDGRRRRLVAASSPMALIALIGRMGESNMMTGWPLRDEPNLKAVLRSPPQT